MLHSLEFSLAPLGGDPALSFNPGVFHNSYSGFYGPKRQLFFFYYYRGHKCTLMPSPADFLSYLIAALAISELSVAKALSDEDSHRLFQDEIVPKES